MAVPEIIEFGSMLLGREPQGCVQCRRGAKMVLLVTGLCPFHCFYCPLSEKKKDRDVIYANERKVREESDVIEEARSISAEGTGITGGDPLFVLERTLHYIWLLKEEFGQEDWVRWQEKRYPEESHGTVPWRVIPDGVQALFANWSMSRKTQNGGWEAVNKHYDMLSEQMGYAVLVPEMMANNLGYQELNRGNPADAIEIFEWNAATYPASANVWDSLAEAMLLKGRLAEAAEYYAKVLIMDPDNVHAAEKLAEIEASQGK